MASANLRAELDCSICLNIYTDPVVLKCGHNFCWDCIDSVLDIQEEFGVYSCPDCREEFRRRPLLSRNRKLRNIVERFKSSQPDQQESGTSCTYCIHDPVPAVISCLHCEASLCDSHRRVHSKSPEHVLCDLTTSLENRKCSVHKKILEYYCLESTVCICVSCRLDGEHQGHQVETLDEASEKKKEELRNVLQKLLTRREEMEERIQKLQEPRRKAEEVEDDLTKRVTALFRVLRRRLEDLEKRVLSEISRQAERVSLPTTNLIQQLNVKKDDLSKKMCRIEELCSMTDPLTVLQDTEDFCDTEDRDFEDREKYYKLLCDGGDLDEAGISHTLHTGLSDIITEVNGGIYIPEPADILLDVNTAHNELLISDDKKSASSSDIVQNHPKTPKRFQQLAQVLSSQSFSTGRHYWEVDIGGSLYWSVGVCYASIDRTGLQSVIGFNNKSWGLGGSHLYAIHDEESIEVPHDASVNRVRVYLDCEAGQISFYKLGIPIRHLHTFTTTFTEPLHAVIGVWGDKDRITIMGGKREKSPHRLLTSQGYRRFLPFANHCNLQ